MDWLPLHYLLFLLRETSNHLKWVFEYRQITLIRVGLRSGFTIVN